MSQEQYEKVKNAQGFIAALDQSGGSTPKALKLYGIPDTEYSGDTQMFDLVHQMRARIITSPVFNGDRILGSILFEMTMDRDIEGKKTAEYLWEVKNVVPFLKVDKGLEDLADSAQVMKPMPGLDDLLERARGLKVFGTKMRSVIKQGDPVGVKAVVDQQFEVARQIIEHEMVPIIEPEIDIHSETKAQAEVLLLAAMTEQLDSLGPNQQVMLKLTPPEIDDFYAPMVAHPNVLRVVALSGGYTRDEADARLARQHGVVASFSRALTQGLTAQQSDEDFNKTLNDSIESIFQASST